MKRIIILIGMLVVLSSMVFADCPYCDKVAVRVDITNVPPNAGGALVEGEHILEYYYNHPPHSSCYYEKNIIDGNKRWQLVVIGSAGTSQTHFWDDYYLNEVFQGSAYWYEDTNWCPSGTLGFIDAHIWRNELGGMPDVEVLEWYDELPEPPEPTPIPEFNWFGILMIVVIAGIGLMVIKRKR